MLVRTTLAYTTTTLKRTSLVSTTAVLTFLRSTPTPASMLIRDNLETTDSL